MQFSTFVMSCAARAAELERTIQRLRASGWPEPPEVVLDDGIGEQPIDRIHRTWQRMIRRAAESGARYSLLLEDDVVFGKWFPHNLLSWKLLHEPAPSGAFYASLYNPSRPFIVRKPEQRFLVADARFVWGAQALVMTPRTAGFVAANWESAAGNPDQRMPLIAARVTPIYMHVPSLVDHAPARTTWGGIEHSAPDFVPDWRAS
jgi:hypothetical protein